MTRYSRQRMLAEVGDEGQRRLSAARVLIVGVGGLGSPVAMYLAAAGVGTIRLADDDSVSLDNLQRQILYTEADISSPKAECAARRLRAMNSDITIEAHVVRVDKDNIRLLAEGCDVVVDGCDNFATRYIVGDATAEMGIPYVYGAICEFEGQAAVFNCQPHSRTYRDLWPDQAAVESYSAPKGVMGPTAAFTAAVQASETLKIICGYGATLAGRLWSTDMRTMQTFISELP